MGEQVEKKNCGRIALPSRSNPSPFRNRDLSYAQALQDLGVHESQLRAWVKKFAEDPQHAFPGNGQMKPEQFELTQLKREVIKLKAERDTLIKAAAHFTKEST